MALKERTRNFFTVTKVKAEKAISEIKVNIAKVEDHRGRVSQAPSPSSSNAAQFGPFKDLKEKIAKVERMYAGEQKKVPTKSGLYEL